MPDFIVQGGVLMPEEDVITDVTYINGQPVYDVDYQEPLVEPMPKSPIEALMEQNAFIIQELATSQFADKNLAEHNAFLTEELAITQLTNRMLAEHQASILILLAEQSTTPDNQDDTEGEPDEPLVQPEQPTEEPNDTIPEEGDGQ